MPTDYCLNFNLYLIDDFLPLYYFQLHRYRIERDNIGHCFIVNNVASEYPAASKHDVDEMISSLKLFGYEWDERRCMECVVKPSDIHICQSCQSRNKIHLFEDLNTQVRTGLHNFPDFWLICLICDHINPYHFINFNPLLYDSVFGKRVLTYRENRGTPDYSKMNELMVGIENYIFLKRGKPHLSKNV